MMMLSIFLVPGSSKCSPITVEMDLPEYDSDTFKSKKEYLWTVKGIAFTNEKRFKRAVKLLEQATDLNPESIAHYWLGLTHEKMAVEKILDWHAKIRERIQSVDLTGRTFSSLEEEAIQKHYKEAFDRYKDAVTYFPWLDHAHYLLGKAALRYFNDLSTAGNYLLSAVRINSREMLYRTELADCYIRLKRFDEARETAEQILKDPRKAFQSEAHAILGRCDLAQSNFSAALKELEKSITLDPDDLFLHYDLARIYRSNQNRYMARKSYQSFIQMVPKDLRQVHRIKESLREIIKLRELKNQ